MSVPTRRSEITEPDVGSTSVEVTRGLRATVLPFLVVGALFGVVFGVLAPPFWGPDEGQHVARVWSITAGSLTPREIPDPRGTNFGGPVPSSIAELIDWSRQGFTNPPGNPDPQVSDPGRLEALLAAPLDGPTVDVQFVNTSTYLPIAYAPAVVGMVVARTLDLPIGGALALMRGLGLLAYLAFGALGLWFLRHSRCRWIVLVVGLVPMSLYQSAVVTTDVMTTGLGIVACSLVIKAGFLRERLSGVEFGVLLAALGLMPLCKSGYVAFLLLVLAVPRASMPRMWHPRLVSIGAMTLAAAAFALWNSAVAATGTSMGFLRGPAEWYAVSPPRQVAWILDHPWSALHVVANTLAVKGNGYLEQAVGSLGSTFVAIPASARVAWLLAAVVALGSAERLVARRATVQVVAAVVVIGVGMIFGALYLAYSPVAYPVVDGVQGRYFIPFFLLLAPLVLRATPLRWDTSAAAHPELVERTVLGLVVLSLAITSVQYYYVTWF